MEWSNIVAALIGVSGIVLGVFLGEFVRRRQRAEQFASTIFERRIEAYDTMLKLLNDGSELAAVVIDNDELTSEERHELISTAITPIAGHATRSALYMDDELTAHCTALFMGVEEIHDLPEAERIEREAEYYRWLREARRMIIEDSGVAEVNRLFRAINRPHITSPFIERLRELRRDQGA